MKYVLKELKNSISITKIANLHFFEFEKDFYTKNEKHPFCEFVFVSAGELYISSEDYTGKLCKHEMILHRPETLHSLTCPHTTSSTVIIIGFECDSDMLKDFSKHPILLCDENIKQLAEIVKEGRNVFAPPYDTPTYNMKKKSNRLFGSEQLLRLLLERFLIDIIRNYRFGLLSQKSDMLNPPPAIHEILVYIDDNYLEKITLDELAFLFNTNRTTLCKNFKEETGMTVISYINQKKIDTIKERIESSNTTFTQISDDLHFDSVHYFTRFFKKNTGFTPKQWRANKKNDSCNNR